MFFGHLPTKESIIKNNKQTIKPYESVTLSFKNILNPLGKSYSFASNLAHIPHRSLSAPELFSFSDLTALYQEAAGCNSADPVEHRRCPQFCQASSACTSQQPEPVVLGGATNGLPSTHESPMDPRPKSELCTTFKS